jgi:glycosyltransferase involved in cell wall biosynthesis
MKVLFLSSRIPHARVVSGHMIVHQRITRLVQRGYQVGLAAFSHEDDSEHIPLLRDKLIELETIPAPQPKAGRRLLDYFISPVPPRFANSYSPAMFKCVGDMVERTRYDVVVAEFGGMGQYLNMNPYLPAVRKVISVHQCQTIAGQKALELLGFSPRAMREWFALKGLQRYEFDMYRSADRILVLTAEERFGVLNNAPDLRITVIPSGVDTDYFKPAEPAVKERAIVFTGYYTDEPNRDAVMWFSHSVWPRLKAKYPDLTFYVVGPGPRPDMLELARKDPRIIVTGEVDDIRPYLARARIFVCPNRLGSGMRGKILQAMASGVPVVSTTQGAEGISIQQGENGFFADKPRIMAQAIDLLLGDPLLQANVARRAREMVADRFSWDRGIDLLETVLHEVVEGR